MLGVFVVRRRVRLGRSGSESRSPSAADAMTDRRVLRRRRRRSQFATAAAAALQAAVSRAAAASRPAFSASARVVGLTPPPVRPLVIKPEHVAEPDQCENADDTVDVEMQAMMSERRVDTIRQQTCSTSGSPSIHHHYCHIIIVHVGYMSVSANLSL